MTKMLSTVVIFTTILLTSCSQGGSSNNLNDIQDKVNREKFKARYENGPFITNETQLSDHEWAKTIIYPGRFGDDYDDLYDVTCLIYVNSQTNTSNMNCDGEFSPRAHDEPNS